MACPSAVVNCSVSSLLYHFEKSFEVYIWFPPDLVCVLDNSWLASLPMLITGDSKTAANFVKTRVFAAAGGATNISNLTAADFKSLTTPTSSAKSIPVIS